MGLCLELSKQTATATWVSFERVVQPSLTLGITAFFTGSLLHSDHRREERGALCQRIRLGHLGLVQRVLMLSALAFLDERTARVRQFEGSSRLQANHAEESSERVNCLDPFSWRLADLELFDVANNRLFTLVLQLASPCNSSYEPGLMLFSTR